MNPLTLEWVKKAEGDFAAAETADKHDARSALKICKQIRALVRESLGLR